MATREAVAANLVAATLVTLASPFAATRFDNARHVRGNFSGIGLLRREEAKLG